MVHVHVHVDLAMSNYQGVNKHTAVNNIVGYQAANTRQLTVMWLIFDLTLYIIIIIYIIMLYTSEMQSILGGKPENVLLCA